MGKNEAIPGYPLQPAQHPYRRGHGGPGVAGTDDGAGITFADKVEGDQNRGILFPADSLDRVLVPFHNLRGVNDPHPGRGLMVGGGLVEDRPQQDFVPHQADIEISLPHGKYCPGNQLLRAMVSSHGVQGNVHNRSPTLFQRQE